jgi:hypothetical protein
MSEQPSRQIARLTQPTPRQQVLLRAVVGSLVLCAALSASASAQNIPSTQQTAPQQPARETNPVYDFRPVYARPFRELLAKTRQLFKSGQLSEQDTFEFSLEAERNEDGTLGNVTLTRAESVNPLWQQLATDFVAALSDSRALQPLRDVSHLNIGLKLNERAVTDITATISTPERAARLADGYNGMRAIVFRENRGHAGIEVLNNMSFSASGKQLSMKLELSREQAGNLLRQHLSIP